MDTRSIGQRFVQLVADLFRREGFNVEIEPESIQGGRPDLLIRSPQTTSVAVVECKVYRSQNVPTSTLDQAAVAIELYRRAFEATHSIIAITSVVAQPARVALNARYPNLVIYDIAALTFLASKDPALSGQLNCIIREAMAFSISWEPHSVKVDIKADFLRPSPASAGPVTVEEQKKGQDVCNELREIKPGAVQAKKFEKTVTKALKYVFDADLTAWAPQKASSTRLSYYDLVARVASRHDFWNTIVSQFRSRYIIFEFKNFSKKITQQQIYTTEKYLFTAALRSTAIIISRKGADENALVASLGALRESGKLIINLDIDDLCAMLHRKDKGDDHNAVMVDRVDDMLMRIER